MTGRRPMVILSGLIALLIAAFLAGLLLLGGSRVPEGDRVPTPVGPAKPGTGDRRSEGAHPPRPADSGHPVPRADAPSPPPAEPFVLEVAARFEDGEPCDDGCLLEMVRGEDGAPGIFLESCMKGGADSSTTGTVSLRWDRRPGEILLLYISKAVEVAAVEGGSLLAPDPQGAVLRAAGDGPLRLTVAWREGRGMVRAKAADTGQWLDGDPPLEARWRLGDGSVQEVLGPGILRFLNKRVPGESGWIPFRPAAPVEGEVQPGAPPVLEVLADGYAVARIPLAAARGRIEVTLDPAVPAVSGEVVVPAAGAHGVPVGWSITPATQGGRAETRVRGRIEKPGPFALFEVPEGRWTLDIWAVTEEGVRWGFRTFEKGAGPLRLGVIEVSGSASIRARVLDADGVPIRSEVRTAPVAGVPAGVRGLTILDRREAGLGTVILQDGSPVSYRDDALPAPDPDGWTTLGDLRPGRRYRIEASWPPGASVEAEAPGEGETKDVEIHVKARPVRCTVRFTVGGEVPAGWGDLMGGLPQDGWRKDGVYAGSLFPGTYRVLLLCRRKAGGEEEMATGMVEVAEGKPLDTTVDLK